MKMFLFILLLASPCFAMGPKYHYEDPNLNDEMDNIYKDIPNVLKTSPVRISSMTVSSATITKATINTLTVTTVNGSPYSSTGKLVQTVNFQTFNSSATTATSFVPTNITNTITPTSASNSVLVIANFICVTTLGGSFEQLDLYRNGSSVTSTNQIGSCGSSGGTVRNMAPIVYLDSPSTTSAVTYTIQFLSSDSNTVRVGNGQLATMILQEIAL